MIRFFSHPQVRKSAVVIFNGALFGVGETCGKNLANRGLNPTENCPCEEDNLNDFQGSHRSNSFVRKL